MTSSSIELLRVQAILAELTAEVVLNASGEHRDRINDGPPHARQ
jgi:hypothetical protein